MPLVTNHSRFSAISREPQMSLPNSIFGLRVGVLDSSSASELALLCVVAIFVPLRILALYAHFGFGYLGKPAPDKLTAIRYNPVCAARYSVLWSSPPQARL